LPFSEAIGLASGSETAPIHSASSFDFSIAAAIAVAPLVAIAIKG